jgi:hypothetical protein
MSTVHIPLQLLGQGLLASIAAVLTSVGVVGGMIRWINRKRWGGIYSSREQQWYLREELRGASYAEGPLIGTVSDIKVSENSGARYWIKKNALARVSGTTEVTIRLDKASIDPNRLDREPFKTVLSEPEQLGLTDAEHVYTKPTPSQSATLIRIRIHSIDYDAVGSWCSALPTLIWRAYTQEQQMSGQENSAGS